jgi:hypothetical protein
MNNVSNIGYFIYLYMFTFIFRIENKKEEEKELGKIQPRIKLAPL